MPMPILIRLNIPKRQRIALVLVFALGGFVCITSGLRLESLRQLARLDDLNIMRQRPPGQRLNVMSQ
ncbi:integral membrane protein [Histoplasma ohiense]|nr:integral membrane protein [Histoplasma ohiense (nom. inval.)]